MLNYLIVLHSCSPPPSSPPPPPPLLLPLLPSPPPLPLLLHSSSPLLHLPLLPPLPPPPPPSSHSSLPLPSPLLPLLPLLPSPPPLLPQGHQVGQRASEGRGWGLCPGGPGLGPDPRSVCGLQAAGQQWAGKTAMTIATCIIYSIDREIFTLEIFRTTIFRGVKFSLSGPSTKIYHQSSYRYDDYGRTLCVSGYNSLLGTKLGSVLPPSYIQS